MWSVAFQKRKVQVTCRVHLARAGLVGVQVKVCCGRHSWHVFVGSLPQHHRFWCSSAARCEDCIDFNAWPSDNLEAGEISYGRNRLPSCLFCDVIHQPLSWILCLLEVPFWAFICTGTKPGKTTIVSVRCNHVQSDDITFVSNSMSVPLCWFENHSRESIFWQSKGFLLKWINDGFLACKQISSSNISKSWHYTCWLRCR